MLDFQVSPSGYPQVIEAGERFHANRSDTPDHGWVCAILRLPLRVRWPGAPLRPDREPASRGLSVEVLFAVLARPRLRLPLIPFNPGLAFVACLCEQQRSNP